MVQDFLQALAIIADECSMELIDAAVQLGADPARLQGIVLCFLLITQLSIVHLETRFALRP